MAQYAPVVAVKKPATVEAWQWDGTPDQAELIVKWIRRSHKLGDVQHEATLHSHDNVIVLGDGFDAVKPGEWVIRDQFNDFWPLPNDIYHTVYSSPVQ